MIDKKTIRKILVIRNDHIGDLILSSRVFRELKRKFPYSKITALVSPVNKQILEKNKNIDNFIIMGYGRNILKNFIKYFSLLKYLRKKKFDVGIDLRGDFLNIFLFMFLSRIKYKIGFYKSIISKYFLNFYYKSIESKHETFLVIDILNKSLNLKCSSYWPEIIVDKKDKTNFKKFLKKNKIQKFICINPDASLQTKQWDLKNFDALIKFFGERYPKYKIILVGSDKEKINFLVKKNPKVISLVKKNLRIVYLLFKKSSLVIAPDGGPMHIAWTAKTNLIALIPRYLNLKNIKPLGRKSKIIYKKMDKITVEEVQKEIKKILKT